MTDSPERPTASAIPLTGFLCAAAGAVDAIAYILFGNIFIANMTGNTVLFAVSMAKRDWSEAELRIGIVFAFLAGIMLARALLEEWMHGRKRRTRLLALGVEFTLLSTLTWVSHAHARSLLLVLLAVAMGAQNDAFRNIDGVKLNTAFITGDLEELGAALVTSEASGKRSQARRRVPVFLTTWSTYAMGALLGASCAFQFAEKALWIPAGLLTLAAVIVMRSPDEAPKLSDEQFHNTPG